MGAHILNQNQLRPLLSGREAFAATNTSTDMREGTNRRDHPGEMDWLWGEKLAEAKAPKGAGVHGAGTFDSMMQHGFDPAQSRDDPINMFVSQEDQSGRISLRQGEGHHRVVAAAEVERVSTIGQASNALLGGPSRSFRTRVDLPISYLPDPRPDVGHTSTPIAGPQDALWNDAPPTNRSRARNAVIQGPPGLG